MRLTDWRCPKCRKWRIGSMQSCSTCGVWKGKRPYTRAVQRARKLEGRTLGTLRGYSLAHTQKDLQSGAAWGESDNSKLDDSI